MRLPASRVYTAILIAATASCGRSAGSPSCGIAALAGATLILNEFAVPGKTLAQPPDQLPGRLPARVAAGPAYAAIVGRSG